ncbi:MAG: hypothetical protein Q4D41_13055 [Prevotellaceae bacterium]|nr:hypothetical protein [Prevotellaceae bacterium]
MNEKNMIKKVLAKNGKDAYKETLSAGRDAVIMRGNNICAVRSDGSCKVLQRLKQSTVRVKSPVVTLK